MSRKNLLKSSSMSAILLAFVACFSALSSAESVTNPDELVAKHLDSVGTAKARSEVKSRADEGTSQFQIVNGGGLLQGKSVLLTDGRKMLFMMSYQNNEYHGERFIFDGDRVEIRAATARQTRSTLGEFLRVQDVIIKDGLLGGVLSTGWPLFNLEERKAKLSYEGVKNIDGHKLVDMRYKPKKNSDLDIHLYFDPETYRHVKTVYTLSVRQGIVDVHGGVAAATPTGGEGVALPTSTTETAQARQNETRYRLEENFSDFDTADGLTLPKHYTIHFTEELQNGQTIITEWENNSTKLIENVPADPKNFQVK